jgi:hypothetical protein
MAADAPREEAGAGLGHKKILIQRHSILLAEAVSITVAAAGISAVPFAAQLNRPRAVPHIPAGTIVRASGVFVTATI